MMFNKGDDRYEKNPYNVNGFPFVHGNGFGTE